MKITWLTLVGLFMVSACAQAVPLPPTVTVENPTSTKKVEVSTPTPSRTPRPSQTPYPTHTQWIKVYPTKKALVIYAAYWRNEYTINFIEWGDFYPEPYLILYEDGQLLLSNSLLEKHLSQEQTTEIMSKLQQLGFFALQNVYEKERDLLFAPNTDRGWHPGPQYFITVDTGEPKTLFYQEYREPYFIEPMKEILKYLNSFSTSNTIPYQPDRLLALIREVETDEIAGTTVRPWPEAATSPLQRSFGSILYLEGAEALQVYKAAGESRYGYFSFEGKNYSVTLRPILPHECHIYHYYEVNFPPAAQPAFTCDDW
ncbi:MAG: hypothetical protein AB1607_16880 [Chloroflexota bacterium]